MNFCWLSSGPVGRVPDAAAIRNMGLVQTVNVPGEVRPMKSFFKGADIFIHLARGDSFSRSLLRTMSTGLVIAADKDADETLLRDKETAILFNSDDDLSIRACLQKLLDDRRQQGRLPLPLRHTYAKIIPSADGRGFC